MDIMFMCPGNVTKDSECGLKGQIHRFCEVGLGSIRVISSTSDIAQRYAQTVVRILNTRSLESYEELQHFGSLTERDAVNLVGVNADIGMLIIVVSPEFVAKYARSLITNLACKGDHPPPLSDGDCYAVFQEGSSMYIKRG